MVKKSMKLKLAVLISSLTLFACGGVTAVCSEGKLSEYNAGVEKSYNQLCLHCKNLPYYQNFINADKNELIMQYSSDQINEKQFMDGIKNLNTNEYIEDLIKTKGTQEDKVKLENIYYQREHQPPQYEIISKVGLGTMVAGALASIGVAGAIDKEIKKNSERKEQTNEETINK